MPTSWFNAATSILNTEINAKSTEYAARGDGVNDDTTPLQNALTDAAGGVLRIPPGTYKTTAQLEGVSDVTILAHGAKIVLDTTSNVDVIRFTNKQNVRIYGLEIDGKKSTKTSSTNTGRGIHIYGGDRVWIEDCYIHDTYEHGIRVGADGSNDVESTQIHIANNRMVDCGNSANDRGYGVMVFWRVLDFVIANNYVKGCRIGGIFVDDASSGAETGKECERFVIEGNVVRNNNGAAGSRGIIVEGCREFSVANNVVLNHADGIVINDGQGGVSTGFGSISGNRIIATRTAIRLLDSTDIVVSGCNCVLSGSTLSTDAAIRIEKGASGGTPSDIIVDGCQVTSDALGISNVTSPQNSGMTNILVQGCLIQSSEATPATGDMGIRFENGTDIAIIGNTIKGFYTGIRIDSSVSSYRIMNNVVIDSTEFGININSVGAVEGNITKGSGTAGYRIDASAVSASTRIIGNIAEEATAITEASAGVLQKYNSFDNLLGRFLRAEIKAIAGDYTVLANDDVLLVTTTGVNRTLTLPTASGVSGKRYVVKKVDSGVGNVIIDGAGSETIDGSATHTIADQYDSVTIISDGSNWAIVNEVVRP